MIRKSVSLLIIVICTFTYGCRKSWEKTWSSKVQSSDGHYIASAETIVNSGGFGTGSIDTTVYLKQTGQDPLLILGFNYNGIPTLDMSKVDMKWLSPQHLEVAYRGHATIDFQAIKCCGVDISLRDISDMTDNSSK